MNLVNYGFPAHGGGVVAALLLRNHLQTQLRERGAAYGTYVEYRRCGQILMQTMAAPLPLRSLSVMQEVGNFFVSGVSQNELDLAKVKIWSDSTRPFWPSAVADVMTTNFIEGRDPASNSTWRAQNLQVTLDDLRSMGEACLRAAESMDVIVAANSTLIDQVNRGGFNLDTRHLF